MHITETKNMTNVVRRQKLVRNGPIPFRNQENKMKHTSCENINMSAVILDKKFNEMKEKTDEKSEELIVNELERVSNNK